MSKASGKTLKKIVGVSTNEYEKLRLQRIESNKTKMANLGVKRIVASMTNLVDSTKSKKKVKRNSGEVTLDKDYSLEDEPLDDSEEEAAVEDRKRKWKGHSKNLAKKGPRKNFIQPNAIGSLVTKNKNQLGKGNKGGNLQITAAALKVLQKAIDSQQEEEEADDGMDLDKVKPKCKPTARDRRKGISPSVTALFGSFNEGEKFRREAEKAKNEATEANAENITLKTRVERLEKENKATVRALECFMNLAGYKLSDLDMDKVFDEFAEDELEEELDPTQNEVEDFGEK